MTALTGIELSKRVAELYEIEADSWGGVYKSWLHEDSARCFELMVEHGLSYCQLDDQNVVVVSHRGKGIPLVMNGDSVDAQLVRMAILQCLVKMKEGQ